MKFARPPTNTLQLKQTQRRAKWIETLSWLLTVWRHGETPALLRLTLYLTGSPQHPHFQQESFGSLTIENVQINTGHVNWKFAPLSFLSIVFFGIILRTALPGKAL